jgi:hypothetical protein
MDALPIEVRQALDRMPMVTGPGTADVLTVAIAKAGLSLCQGQRRGREDTKRQAAAKIAAACIRLVEHFDQEWP